MGRPRWRWPARPTSSVQKHKDGLALDAQGLSSLTTALPKPLPASSRTAGDTSWLDETQTRSAAAYGIVTVPHPGDNAQRLLGGRLLERVHLWRAANGFSRFLSFRAG